MFFLAPCDEGSVKLIQSDRSMSSSASGIITLCGSSLTTNTTNNLYLICDYGWGYEEASVACKSLGYSPYGAVPLFNQYISSESGFSFLSYVNCSGSEESLNECQLSSWFGSCFYNYAGAVCQGWI